MMLGTTNIKKYNCYFPNYLSSRFSSLASMLLGIWRNFSSNKEFQHQINLIRFDSAIYAHKKKCIQKRWTVFMSGEIHCSPIMTKEEHAEKF